MKLLIVTQVIDLDDPILGFFHRWVGEFAKHFEHIEVICLKLGRHSLPTNVSLYSLGKEKKSSRIKYVARFGWLIWKLRPYYDHVFVHMNPEYVILGGLDWRIMGKKIFFWYNHPRDNWRLRLATHLAHRIFYTSPYSATARVSRAVRMPAGIDTDIFKPQPVTRNRYSLYMQGRVAPSKHVDIALAALRIIRKSVPEITLTIVGPEDETYGKQLREEFADILDAVMFLGPKPNRETPALYSAHSISINLAADGHYDKSVLESVACGTPVALSSEAFGEKREVESQNMFLLRDRTPEALSEMVLFMLKDYERWEEQVDSARRTVIEHHSLEKLAPRLIHEMEL